MVTKEELFEYLDKSGAVYKKITHVATLNSQESAEARGEDVSIGGKAIVMKLDENFYIFILSASKKIDSAALRKRFNAKRIRFATEKELLELTGLEPNCVPPFGRPLIDLDIFVDHSVHENEKIAFNAASKTDSVVMEIEQYKKLFNQNIFSFSK